MGGKDEHTQGRAADSRFFPVPVDALDFQTLQMDLYLRYDGAPPTLYRARGVEFTSDDMVRLAERGVQFLHIPAVHHGAYRQSMARRLDQWFRDPERAAIERGRIIRASCSKIIEDVLLFPGESEPIQSVAEISKTFSQWSRQDPAAFSYLMDMSSHDFGTATHMINVGVGCGLIAREMDADDDDLFSTVVQGGMLHDLGKRGIPEAILNKEGKLNAEEWKVISAHPMKGYEELRRNPTIPQAVLSMVRDHHEHLSGSGYPQGLRADQISLPARLCAVIDVFDAITAARPYRGPTPPADTIKIMNDGRGKQFDPKIFDLFQGIVDRLLEADPTRAPAEGDAAGIKSLSELLPRSARPAAPKVPDIAFQPRSPTPLPRKNNRRRFDRFGCNLPATASFLHQGKPVGVRIGQPFSLRIVDIGRGGLKVLTPWPPSINDVLSIEVQPKDGDAVQRLCRVVRVRKHAQGWASGVAFIQAGAEGESEAA
jgi:HD-GYP domain-containing protein (c-di-GMP phosphodiesterase class II)